jgi:hypothetical protein
MLVQDNVAVLVYISHCFDACSTMDHVTDNNLVTNDFTATENEENGCIIFLAEHKMLCDIP